MLRRSWVARALRCNAVSSCIRRRAIQCLGQCPPRVRGKTRGSRRETWLGTAGRHRSSRAQVPRLRLSQGDSSAPAKRLGLSGGLLDNARTVIPSLRCRFWRADTRWRAVSHHFYGVFGTLRASTQTERSLASVEPQLALVNGFVTGESTKVPWMFEKLFVRALVCALELPSFRCIGFQAAHDSELLVGANQLTQFAQDDAGFAVAMVQHATEVIGASDESCAAWSLRATARSSGRHCS